MPYTTNLRVHLPTLCLPVPFDVVNVKIVGPEGDAKVEVVQLEPSEFGVTYLAPVPGNYFVTILLYGRNILGQPLKTIVTLPTTKQPAPTTKAATTTTTTLTSRSKPGGTVTTVKAPIRTTKGNVNPSMCAVSTEAGDEGINPVFDDDGPFNFKVTAKDDDGNLFVGVPCDVTVSCGDETFPVNVKDNADGTFDVQWEPKDVGDYNVAVNVDGKPIKGSPFPIEVKPIASSKHSAVEFKHVIQCSVKVQTFNRDGSPKKTGGDPIKVQVTGKEGPLDFDVTDNNDGTYTVSWEAHPGEYQVSAKIRGKHIKGSPFSYVANFEVKH